MAAKTGQVTDAESFLAAFRVSRETIERLSLYESLLSRWQETINLVAHSTLKDVWGRHFADSAQLAALVPPGAQFCVDIGSGGGFPGLVLAILFRDRPGFAMHLIESDQRKAAFLRAAAASTGAAAQVHAARAEAVAGVLSAQADRVTARACAPLERLLPLAAPFLKPGGLCLFLKGRGVEEELTAARKYWRFSLNQIASVTDPEGRVLEVKGLRRADD